MFVAFFFAFGSVDVLLVARPGLDVGRGVIAACRCAMHLQLLLIHDSSSVFTRATTAAAAAATKICAAVRGACRAATEMSQHQVTLARCQLNS
jgi:hypothetical protein